MKDEIRECNLKIRVTPKEKEQIRAYAEKHNLTMSEAIRQLCYKIFSQEEKQ